MTSSAAEIILFNGAVATRDARRPSAVAVGRGRILAVGADDPIQALAGPHTSRIDLNGRLVVPGFIDTHIHFHEWAMQRRGVKLDDVTRLEELLERVSQAAGRVPPGQWILGQGWNETDWVASRMPLRDSQRGPETGRHRRPHPRPTRRPDRTRPARGAYRHLARTGHQPGAPGLRSARCRSGVGSL